MKKLYFALTAFCYFTVFSMENRDQKIELSGGAKKIVGEVNVGKIFSMNFSNRVKIKDLYFTLVNEIKDEKEKIKFEVGFFKKETSEELINYIFNFFDLSFLTITQKQMEQSLSLLLMLERFNQINDPEEHNKVSQFSRSFLSDENFQSEKEDSQVMIFRYATLGELVKIFFDSYEEYYKDDLEKETYIVINIKKIIENYKGEDERIENMSKLYCGKKLKDDKKIGKILADFLVSIPDEKNEIGKLFNFFTRLSIRTILGLIKINEENFNKNEETSKEKKKELDQNRLSIMVKNENKYQNYLFSKNNKNLDNRPHKEKYQNFSLDQNNKGSNQKKSEERKESIKDKFFDWMKKHKKKLLFTVGGIGLGALFLKNKQKVGEFFTNKVKMPVKKLFAN